MPRTILSKLVRALARAQVTYNVLAPKRVVWAHTNPSFTQSHYRIRSDDTVALNTSSGWAAALDTGATIDVDTTFRVRIEIEETASGTSTAPGGQLEVSLNGGAYQSVTTSSTIVKAVASGQFNEGDATSNLIAGSSRTFAAGTASEDGVATTPSLSNQHTEVEYAIQIVSGDVSDGDTITFRVAGLNSYTNTGTITVNEAAGPVSGDGAATIQLAAAGTGEVGVTASLLEASGSNADQSSYDTGSVSPKADRLLLVAFTTEKSSGVEASPTVSGLGLTWTVEASVPWADNGSPTRYLHLAWATTGSSAPTPGAVTMSMGSSQVGCAWVLTEHAGADLTDPIVQAVTNFSDTAGTAASATLAAFEDALNATYGVVAKNATASNTPGTGFTMVGEGTHDTPNIGVSAEFRKDNDTSVDQTNGVSTKWGFVAAEIRDAANASSGGPSGDGALTIQVTGAGDGSVLVQGDGTGAIQVSAAADASVQVQGDGAASIQVSAASDGSVLVQADGAATIQASVAGTGSVSDPGGVTGNGALTVEISAAGDGSVAVQADGASTIQLSGAGDGSVLVQGTSTPGPVRISAVADGSVLVQGTSTPGPVRISAAADGSVLVQGDGATTIQLGAAGDGSVVVSGDGTGTVQISAAGAGSGGLSGDGAATIELSAAADGSVAVTGDGAGTVQVSTLADGSVQIEGSGAATIQISADGVATRVVEVSYTGAWYAQWRRANTPSGRRRPSRKSHF